MATLLVFLLVSLQACLSQCETRLGNPTVIVGQGKIEGKDIRYDWGKIDRFAAIPYAAPPVGDLRFRNPLAHPGWTGTYDATGELGSELMNKACIQPRPNNDLRRGAIGTEDCLYLNVWVPGGVDDARKNPLPVMVWIHGEAYSYGSSWGPLIKNERLYDMTSISSYGNVIGVSFNYRLGPMGFLSTGDESSPGNYGLLDQAFALQWIQDNIWAFGGRPDKVTIFGQSTGSTSVGLHMVSPISSNLFTRAISQSGTSLSQWSIQRNPAKYANKLGEKANCSSENSQELVDCLRGLPAEDVVMGVRVYGFRKLSNLDLPWAPVIDGNFLPAPPETLIATAAKKDYLMGNNNMDGHAFAVLDFPFVRLPIVPMTELSLLRASRRLSPYISPHISQLIDFQYQKYQDGRDKHYYKDVLVDLYTDFMFNAPTYSMAQQHSFLAKNMSTGANTYVYLFTQPKTRTFLNGELDGKLPGAEHGEEVQFVFDVPDRAGLRYSRAEKDLANSMITYWTNFAWTGNPNEGGAKDEAPTTWPAYDLNNQHYLNLNTSLTDNKESAVGFSFRRDFTVFWSRLVPQIYGSKSSVCENVVRNEFTRSKQLSVKGTERIVRPKYSFGEPSDEDFMRLRYFQPSYRQTSCEGTGDFIRQTAYGCVQGAMGKWQGRLYSRYLGIPYAASPSGESRFEKPSSPTSWTGTRDAKEFSKICPQSPYDPSKMSEDCLYLNIYAPIDSSLPYDTVVPGKYAVMIWLHGGGYMTGDGAESYMGDILSTMEGVIVVTFNYRLGSLGFMSTGNRFSPGNFGMFDQNMAMTWVVENIEGFGGDPDRVVMFGQGAGAESAQLHTLSLTSRSLGMNRTILQSGTLFDFYEYPDQTEIANELIARTGCKRASTSDSVDCLRTVPIEDLIAAQEGSAGSEALQFAPVVDGSFLVRDPQAANSVLTLRDWNFLIGSNSGDGTAYWSTVNGISSGEQFRSTVQSSFKESYGVSSDDIQFEYTEWTNEFFDDDVEELQKQAFSMYTDQRYVTKAEKVAFKTAGVLSNVYLYSLDYPYSSTEQQQYPEWTGVMHGGDLPYIWGDIVREPANQGAYPEASVLSFKMMKYWANYAKTGDPNLGDNGAVVDDPWPRYRSLRREYVRLDGSGITQNSYLRGMQSSFWNFILPTLRVSCPLYIQ